MATWSASYLSMRWLEALSDERNVHKTCVWRAQEEDFKKAKMRINLSLDVDTVERLKQYALENHSTVSKAVTDMVWAAKVKNKQIRGQLSIAEDFSRK